MTKQWNVPIEGKEYTVELEHNAWTNVQRVRLNGQMIYETPGKVQLTGATCFTIEGHECVVIVTNKMLGFDYDLVVDGVSIVTRKKVKYPALKPVATMINGIVR